jgi:acetate kinase
MNMILTLNAGSSSVKFGLYCATDKPEPEVKAKGQIDGLGLDAQLIVQIGQGPPQKIALGSTDQATGISAILQALAPILAGRPVSGVGHRIVHGGPNIRTPMILNAEVLADLRQYIPLAPLHQPHNLAAVAAAQAAFPDALQVGCFDTAFHRDHPWVNDTFA